MIVENLNIINKLGLHARATAAMVRLLQQYRSEVTLQYNKLSANGKSIMSVMMLAAAKGSEITFTVEGDDEEMCFLALSKLLAERFGEKE